MNISFSIDYGWFWCSVYAIIKCKGGGYRSVTIELVEKQEDAEKLVAEYRKAFNCKYRF